MNPNDNNDYNPANDDNQGVAQLMAQGADANPGVSQVERMNPVMDSGPEPIKEEVNDDPDNDGDSSLNTDELTEEAVESNSLTVNGIV